MGMALDQGGHLTHGSPANQSGKWFKVVSYGVKPDSHLIDYEQMEETARREKPKLIVAGASAYSRHIDWARFRKVADEIGAFFMVDMAHYAGLVAAGVYPSPLAARPCRDDDHAQDAARPARRHGAVDRCRTSARRSTRRCSPACRAGRLMHIIAAKAVAFGEALRPDFKVYAQNVVDNARSLASALTERGLKIISGGTDSHVMLVDLRPKKATGVSAEKVLDRAGITVNKNSIPGDPEKYTITSGVRLGSPAGTTRGFGVGGVPPGRPSDRRRARRHRQERPGRRRPGRGAGARQGSRALCPLSDLPRLTQAQKTTGGENALSILRSRGHPG